MIGIIGLWSVVVSGLRVGSRLMGMPAGPLSATIINAGSEVTLEVLAERNSWKKQDRRSGGILIFLAALFLVGGFWVDLLALVGLVVIAFSKIVGPE